jgi:hypothetical protein
MYNFFQAGKRAPSRKSELVLHDSKASDESWHSAKYLERQVELAGVKLCLSNFQAVAVSRINTKPSRICILHDKQFPSSVCVIRVGGE